MGGGRYIRCNGQTKSLWQFEREKDAAEAYRVATTEHFGNTLARGNWKENNSRETWKAPPQKQSRFWLSTSGANKPSIPCSFEITSLFWRSTETKIHLPPVWAIGAENAQYHTAGKFLPAILKFETVNFCQFETFFWGFSAIIFAAGMKVTF